MDIPEYQEKYSKPYEKGTIDRLPRKLKQMSDARFNKDRHGISVGGVIGTDPAAFGAEIGHSYYPVPWTSIDTSLTGFAVEGGFGWMTGFKIGQRFHSPSRFSPFVGYGFSGGVNSRKVLADNDGRDNDDDIFIDEPGEKDDLQRGIFTVYPEVGLQYWLNSSARLSLSSQYHFNSDGRDQDFLVTGLSVSFYSKPDRIPTKEEWKKWGKEEVGEGFQYLEN